VGESIIGPFVQALVGEPQTATAAFAAEVHKENDARRSNRRLGTGTVCHDDPRGLVSRRHGGAIEVCAQLRGTDGIGPAANQQLPSPGPRDGLLNEFDDPVATELRVWSRWEYVF
jgi:hypothetical protein